MPVEHEDDPHKPRLTLTAITLGTTMVSLDGTIVLIAQPVLQRDLGASLAQIQWVTNGYLLAVGTFLIIAGRIGDRIGYRLTFVAGVLGFAAVSGLIAAVDDIGWLIGLRVAQGVCGAFLQPATIGLLRESYPDDGLDLPIAIRSAAIGVSTAAGPVVGGLLVEQVSWRAVFLINLPIGLVTILLVALRGRAPSHPRTPASFDLVGAVVLAVFMFALFAGVTQVAAHGVWEVRSVVPVVVVLLAAVLLVRRESRTSNPLLPPALLTTRNLAVGFLLVVCLAFAMMGTLFLETYYVLNHLGMDPVRGGVLVLPLTVTIIVVAPLSGLLMRRLNARVLVAAGLFLTAGAVFGLSRVSGGTLALSLLLFLLGLGLAPALVGTTKIIVANLPRSAGGLAGGLHQTGMQVGSGVGIAVVGTLLATRTEGLLGPGYPPQAVSDASVGLHRQIPGMPDDLAATWDQVSGQVFLNGLSHALMAAVAVALAGAAGALIGLSRVSR